MTWLMLPVSIMGAPHLDRVVAVAWHVAAAVDTPRVAADGEPTYPRVLRCKRRALTCRRRAEVPAADGGGLGDERRVDQARRKAGVVRDRALRQPAGRALDACDG